MGLVVVFERRVATREGWISTRDGGYERGMDKYKRWWLQDRDG
jgi:hypothetical protein